VPNEVTVEDWGISTLGADARALLEQVVERVAGRVAERAAENLRGGTYSTGKAAASVLGGLVMLDDAGGEPEEGVELAHALGIAAGEVVVHRDDVDAAPGEGVEVDGEGGDEGLALAGRHLGDADRKSTRLNSSHVSDSRMPSSA